MIITLIGYRGSGKTSVARPLATQLGWDWIDADPVIEERAGCTIKELFATQGEPAFRALEEAVLAELLARDRLVVASGGGAILNAQTRARMQAAGPVVWLMADVDTLWERIIADTTTAARRPNLTAQGGRDEIAALLARREPLYREAATLTIDTTGLEPDKIVEHIAQRLPPEFLPGATC